MVVDLASYTSRQIKFINEFVRAIIERDVSLLAKYLHKDFCHVIHPRSLGKPPINGDEWLEMMAQIFSTPIQFEKPTYHSIVEAPGKVVIHASVAVKGLSEQDGTDESIWIVELTVGEDGTLKIKGIEQFTDTNTHVDVPQAIKARK